MESETWPKVQGHFNSVNEKKNQKLALKGQKNQSCTKETWLQLLATRGWWLC